MVAGVTAPEFDGITVAVLAVRSAAEGFSADVETVPGLRHWRMFRTAVDKPTSGLVGRGRPWPPLSRPARQLALRPGPWRRADRVLARARPRGEGARHHAHHDDRAGRDPGAAGAGVKTDERAVVAGRATGRGPVSCAGREHQLRWAGGELRVPGHPDLESEKILRALAGESLRLPGRAGGVGAARRRPACPGPGQPRAGRSGDGPARRAWAHGLDRQDRPDGAATDAAPPVGRDRGAGRRSGGVRGTVRTPWPRCSAWAVRCRPG